jgi:hypothetical protein
VTRNARAAFLTFHDILRQLDYKALGKVLRRCIAAGKSGDDSVGQARDSPPVQ